MTPSIKSLILQGARSVRMRLSARFAEPSTLLSFAQEGEDRVLHRLLGARAEQTGFYVDVGAHHPIRFSNTYLFYKLGWRGVNLDAMPGSMTEFDRLRPRDTNLEVAVAEQEGKLEYHQFTEPALNTFAAELAETYRHLPWVKHTGTAEIACRRLEHVLAEHVPQGTRIDFLSVDVEGLDLQVLRSNDWKRFRPEFVLIEALEVATLAAVADADVSHFLAGVGYEPVAKTVNTVFYRDHQSAPVDK